MANIWQLHEDADELIAASERWSDVSEALTSASDSVDTGARSVRDAGWEGATADSFDDHRRRLVGDLDVAHDVAGSIASTLAKAAGSVRVAQGNLDLSWATVASIPHEGSPSGEIRFRTADEAEAERVRQAITRAQEVRDDLDAKLAGDIAALTEATTTWQRISATWESVANGTSDGFDVPDDGDETGVITVGDRTIVNTGGGDDEVSVFIDPFTGEQIVIVNGTVHRLPAGQEIVIRAGEGNDRIGVPKGVDLDITLIGGEGDDNIHGGDGDDHLYGLDGHDYVDAGAGDDYASGGADRDYLDGQDGDDTLSGGDGNDTVYGLDGDDTITGDEGNDYLEGASGDDEVQGGAGNDTLSGGTDDDSLHGGSGDDVTYAGKGDDESTGGTGADTTYAEEGDTTDAERSITIQIKDVPDFIKIEGSPEFQERVRADLELLAASPRGQQMLGDFRTTYDDSGFLGFNKSGLTISEFPDNSNSSASPNGEDISYSPRIDWIHEGPPIVVLFHEMAHAYDFRHDQFDRDVYQGDDPADHGDPNGERIAVGLPVDHDDDPDTPERLPDNHDFDLTENGLRDEMGVELRPNY